MTTGTVPTGQIRFNKMHVQHYLLRNGIHDKGLDLEATKTGRSHDPNDRDRGPQLLKATGLSMTRGRLPTPVRCPQKLGGDDENHGEDHVAQDGW